jgi:carbonic anhydrase
MNLDVGHSASAAGPAAEPAPDSGAEPGAELVEVAAPLTASAQALDRLAAGNGRLIAAIASSRDPAAALSAFAKAEPYAVILGCSDSRVPPEIVFDETVGRLFVIRVASGVAGTNEIGSIEYALARWECPLVVVLGHTQCGGIAAALEKLPPGAEPPPDASGWMHLSSLVFAIRSGLGYTGALAASPDPWRAAVELNVRRTVELLLNWSEPIRRRVTAGQLAVVGAIYDVERARVELLAG